MAWFDRLSSDTIGGLFDRFPDHVDLEAAAVVVVRRPENTGRFAYYGGEVYTTPEVDYIGRRREEWEPVEYVSFPDTEPSGPVWLARVLLADTGEQAGRTPQKKKPRHRHPGAIAEETIKKLKWELAQRKARPRRDPEFTQEKIASRVELDRGRVQQAEALQRVGWDLLRSQPEFSADDGFVRWPSVEKAAQILASERAENSRRA